jgi:hypothetical protein
MKNLSASNSAASGFLLAEIQAVFLSIPMLFIRSSGNTPGELHEMDYVRLFPAVLDSIRDQLFISVDASAIHTNSSHNKRTDFALILMTTSMF